MEVAGVICTLSRNNNKRIQRGVSQTIRSDGNFDFLWTIHHTQYARYRLLLLLIVQLPSLTVLFYIRDSTTENAKMTSQAQTFSSEIKLKTHLDIRDLFTIYCLRITLELDNIILSRLSGAYPMRQARSLGVSHMVSVVYKTMTESM